MKAKKINLSRILSGSKLADYTVIAVGALFCAVSVNMFIVPNNIVSSGVTGISTILNHLYGFPVGLSILILNFPLFIWGGMENGWRFIVKTVVATVLISVFIDLLEPFVAPYREDVFLAAVFGGILSGFGFALIFYKGATAGGIDIIARNLNNRFPHISVGTWIFISNWLVIIAAGAVYRSIESMLFPVVELFISVKVMDSVLYGFARNNGKLMFVISDKYEQIRESILNDISRGLTIIDAQGGFSSKNRKIILCAVRPSQAGRLNKLVLAADENAFIITTTANAISGEGFQNRHNF